MGVARQRRKNSSVQIAREDLASVNGTAGSASMSSQNGSNVNGAMVRCKMAGIFEVFYILEWTPNAQMR